MGDRLYPLSPQASETLRELDRKTEPGEKAGAPD